MDPFTPVPLMPPTADDAGTSSVALLSVHEAARLLNVTPSWIYEHVRPSAHDRLPHVKLGKFVRFHPHDLAAYIDARRAAAARRRPR